MPLVPKSFKFKKYRKGRIKTNFNKTHKSNFGHIFIKAIEHGRITSRQLEAGRKLIKKKIKPFGGIIKTKVKLKIPVTAKPISVRMGRGKGKVSFHVCPIKSGVIIYEIYCVNLSEALKAANNASYKLPINVKTIIRNV